MKAYVKEYTRKNVDDEKMQVVKIYPSSEKPGNYKYIIFQEK